MLWLPMTSLFGSRARGVEISQKDKGEDRRGQEVLQEEGLGGTDLSNLADVCYLCESETCKCTWHANCCALAFRRIASFYTNR